MTPRSFHSAAESGCGIREKLWRAGDRCAAAGRGHGGSEARARFSGPRQGGPAPRRPQDASVPGALAAARALAPISEPQANEALGL